MTAKPLKPGPFCGESDYLLVAQVRAGRMQWWVVECGCHANGGAAPTEAEAIDAWHKRAHERPLYEALLKVREDYAEELAPEYVALIDNALADSAGVVA